MFTFLRWLNRRPYTRVQGNFQSRSAEPIGCVAQGTVNHGGKSSSKIMSVSNSLESVKLRKV